MDRASRIPPHFLLFCFPLLFRSVHVTLSLSHFAFSSQLRTASNFSFYYCFVRTQHADTILTPYTSKQHACAMAKRARVKQRASNIKTHQARARVQASWHSSRVSAGITCTCIDVLHVFADAWHASICMSCGIWKRTCDSFSRLHHDRSCM